MAVFNTAPGKVELVTDGAANWGTSVIWGAICGAAALGGNWLSIALNGEN